MSHDSSSTVQREGTYRSMYVLQLPSANHLDVTLGLTAREAAVLPGGSSPKHVGTVSLANCGAHFFIRIWGVSP